MNQQHAELRKLRADLIDSLNMERDADVMTEREQLEDIRFRIRRTVHAIDQKIRDQPVKTH